jgi:hypothetical protein
MHQFVCLSMHWVAASWPLPAHFNGLQRMVDLVHLLKARVVWGDNMAHDHGQVTWNESRNGQDCTAHIYN